MWKLKIMVLGLVYFFISQVSYSQEKSIWARKFDDEINTPGKNIRRNGVKINNWQTIKNSSSSGNSFSFMYLGPILDGFNTMFLTTNDEKYLEYAHSIMQNIITNSSLSKRNKRYKTWYVSTNQERYKSANNNEWMLFEGHFFRYAVQYLHIVKTNSHRIKNKKIIEDNSRFIQFVYNNVWLKWQKASQATRGDLTLLYGVRVHNGAHWATIAKYLEVLIEKNQDTSVLRTFYSDYDSWLRKNLKKVNNSFYVWNSTWDNPFLQAHKDRISKGMDEKRFQDTAHGNHVLQYVIASYNLGSNWSKKDLQYFSQTLLDRVIDNKTMQCYETVERKGLTKYIDLSDGWLKLARHNRDLEKLLFDFYKLNGDRIDESHQNLQFYALALSVSSL